MTTLEQQSPPTPRSFVPLGLAREVALVGDVVLSMRHRDRRLFGNVSPVAFRECARALREIADAIELIAEVGAVEPDVLFTFDEHTGAHVIVPLDQTDAENLVDRCRAAVTSSRSRTSLDNHSSSKGKTRG